MLKRRPAQQELLPPVMVTFTITRQCNLRCKHCYSYATDSPHQQELTTDEAKRVISEVAGSGARVLVFDGGEPLMRADVYDLISHARERGLYALMGTNATLLSTEATDKLRRAGVGAVAISLNGTNALSHDQFSCREGSWDRAMAGIRNASSAGLPFQINTCLHRDNWAEFGAMASMVKGLGATAFEVFDFTPVGRGKEHPDLALSAEERQEVVRQAIEHQLGDDITYRCIGMPQLIVQAEKTVETEEDRRRFIRACCGAGRRYCCIFYEGTVFPCPLLQKRAGNVREKSFQEIWEGADVFKTLRNREKLGGKCKRCIYRYECGGARCLVFAKTGSLNKEDGYCWYKGKQELQTTPQASENPCNYCERGQLVNCQVCGLPMCEEHSLYCPVCHDPVCHPDVKDCFFQHDCLGAVPPVPQGG
jgi:MoaA/NifB/PqqE/SkfB family radical SAM enzyme